MNYKLRKLLDDLYLAFDICDFSFEQKLKISTILDKSTNKSDVDLTPIFSIKKLTQEQKYVLQYTIICLLNYLKEKAILKC